MSGLREAIDNPTIFSIVAPGEITILYVIIISLNVLVGWVASPFSMATCGAGKSEHESRVGFVSGMLLKRLCTIAWVLTGLAAIALYAGTDTNADHVYGMLARDFLPTIAPGLLGLFVASLIAAVMSSCDTFMLSCAALFTENLYKPFINPNQEDRHYILVGRISSALVVIGGILIALGLSSVVRGVELFWIVQAMMGIAIWVSFFWRRATSAAVWASTAGGFAAWFFTSDVALVGWSFNAQFSHLLPEFMVYDSLLALPWQMIIYLSVALALMVGVSLVTEPPSKERLDQVYETLRTPVLPGEPEVEPVTLPASTKPAPRSVLIDHPDFELMKPTVSTVFGFLAIWVMVGVLIALFVWILKL